MSERKEQLESENVEQQIRQIIQTVSGQEIDTGADGLQQINMDSLTRLEILSNLESVFQVELTEEVAQQFTSISSIARIILRARNARQARWRLSI